MQGQRNRKIFRASKPVCQASPGATSLVSQGSDVRRQATQQLAHPLMMQWMLLLQRGGMVCSDFIFRCWMIVVASSQFFGLRVGIGIRAAPPRCSIVGVAMKESRVTIGMSETLNIVKLWMHRLWIKLFLNIAHLV